jgi:hypothetical protein
MTNKERGGYKVQNNHAENAVALFLKESARGKK